MVLKLKSERQTFETFLGSYLVHRNQYTRTKVMPFQDIVHCALPLTNGKALIDYNVVGHLMMMTIRNKSFFILIRMTRADMIP